MTAKRSSKNSNTETRKNWSDGGFNKDEFNRLVLWMHSEGWKYYADRSRLPSRNRHSLERIYSYIEEIQNSGGAPWQYIMEPQRLEQKLKVGRLLDDGSNVPCIVLPPITRHGIVPILAPKFRFASDHQIETKPCYPEVRLRTVLFWESNPDEIRSIGYRIEVPEGPGARTHSLLAEESDEEEEPGSHDFVHIQHITSFAKNGPNLPEVVDLPCVAPAWPLWGWDPTSLLVSLLVGLYGLKHAQQIEPPDVGDIIRGTVNRLIRSPPPQTYQVINVNKQRLHDRHLYVETWPQQRELISVSIKAQMAIGGDTEVVKEAEEHSARIVTLVEEKIAHIRKVFWDIDGLNWP